MRKFFGKCAKCGERDQRGRGQAWCSECHAEWMRMHRKKHSEQGAEARKRANARAYARTYEKRGKLKKEACEVCGETETEKHHDDYDKPLDVRWFCREHHMAVHGKVEKKKGSTNPVSSETSAETQS